MKIITISSEQFDNFAKNHMYKNYYQSSSYGKVLEQAGFKIEYIGIVDDVNLMFGASLLAYKNVFMGKKLAYAPRGILFNYDSTSSLEELVKCLKAYLSKQGCLLLRMDPYIPATIRNKKGKASNMNKNINNIMANLKQAGFTYKGQNKFFENELSRYEGVLLFQNRTIKDIYLGFDKNIRHKINKAANSGVIVLKDNNKNVNTLFKFCKENGIINIKNAHKSIINAFGDKASIYYALLDTNAFVSVSKNIYEKEMDKNDSLSKKIQTYGANNAGTKQKLLNTKIESDKLLNTYKNQLVEATNLLEKNPKSIMLGAAITVEYDNAIYLIEEFHTKYLSNLCANYLIRWFIINETKNRNYKYFNMNAMTGEFVRPNPYMNLNKNKLGFGCVPTEYIGEFELVIDGFNYKLYQSFSKEKNYKFKNDIK